jgi:hypothetical protein
MWNEDQASFSTNEVSGKTYRSGDLWGDMLKVTGLDDKKIFCLVLKVFISTYF